MNNPLTRRPGFTAPPALAQLRSQLAGAAARYPRHPAVAVAYSDIGGIRCLELIPANPQRTLVFFHGGGFRLGSPEIAAGFTSRLAALAHCRVVIPFYSLAPEQPFPAALLDGEAVISSLTSEGPLLVGGDSAGGNLAAVLAHRHAGRIAGALLISPWLDLRVIADSYQRNGGLDKVFSRQAAQDAAALYLQGHSSLDGDVSPLLADLTRMPPCLIAVGSGEVLVDDAVQFAAALAAQQRRVSLDVLPGMSHVEPMLQPDRVNAGKVLALAARFVLDQVGSA